MPTLADLQCEQAVTIAPDESLETALERLLDFHATELYVVDADDRLLGVLPDYELLKARVNGTWDDWTVEQIMSHRVVCFTEQTTLAEALRLFREGQHSRAAYLEEGRLCGQVTRTTLLRWLSETDAEAAGARFTSPKFLHSAHTVRGYAEALCS